jgi:Asp-tRNA(Asn)/Glu-tRNA(Gln) amidotransferase A subunit family amidase
VDAASVFEPLIAERQGRRACGSEADRWTEGRAGDPRQRLSESHARERRLARDAIFKLFGDVDMLLAPTRLGPAPKIDEPLDQHPDRARPKDAGFTA